jgi:hypothetical protein
MDKAKRTSTKIGKFKCVKTAFLEDKNTYIYIVEISSVPMIYFETIITKCCLACDKMIPITRKGDYM